MGPAGDICRRLSDLSDCKDLRDLKDLGILRGPKNLSNPKDSKFLLNSLLRAMWRPLRAKKRNFNHF